MNEKEKNTTILIIASTSLLLIIVVCLFNMNVFSKYTYYKVNQISWSNNSLNPVNFIQWNTSYVGTPYMGKVYWDQNDGTLDLGMIGNDVNLQIGQELLMRVKNVQGKTIYNGQLVYISGGTGANPTIRLANASNYNSTFILGMATENILNNDFGYVTEYGLVRDVNTAAYAPGTELWLNNIGNYTSIKPNYPQESVIVGTVVRQQSQNGVILVNPIRVENIFGNPKNNTHYEADGTLVFTGNATVFDDMQGTLASAKLPTANPVVWKTWKGNLGAYAFEEKISNLEESLELTVQMSHKIKTGSPIECHLHYNVPTASTQNIKFYLEYNCANVSSTYYSTNKNKTVTFTLNNIAYRNSIADFDGLTGCMGSMSQIEKFFLKRLSSQDTYTGDVYVDYFDCHYEIDTIGSRTENSK